MRQQVELLGEEEVQQWIHHVSLLLHFLKECHYLLWGAQKKTISPQAIKYDRGRSEDEFKKVIVAYLRVRGGTQ